MQDKEFAGYFLHPTPSNKHQAPSTYLLIFDHVSLRETVRLNTSFEDVES